MSERTNGLPLLTRRVAKNFDWPSRDEVYWPEL